MRDELQIFRSLLATHLPCHALNTLWGLLHQRNFFSCGAHHLALESWIFPLSLKKEKKSQLTGDSSPRTLRGREFGILINILDVDLSYFLPCSPGSMAPSRKHDITAGAMRALIAGTIACFLTACIAGIMLCCLCPVSLCSQDGNRGQCPPPTYTAYAALESWEAEPLLSTLWHEMCGAWYRSQE